MQKKRIRILGLLLVLMSVGVSAQNLPERARQVEVDSVIVVSGPSSSMPVEGHSAGANLEWKNELEPVSEVDADTSKAMKPLFSPLAVVRPSIVYYPDDYWYGSGLWSLHEGFNACLNMSVTTSFGRNRFPGVGFGTGISAMYAKMLTDRLVMAVGGFYNHLSWNNFNENHFGLNVMMGYHFNDHVSVYAYGSKAFWPTNHNRMIPPFPYFDAFGERFGGMLHIKVNDSFSFSVGVEELRR